MAVHRSRTKPPLIPMSVSTYWRHGAKDATGFRDDAHLCTLTLLKTILPETFIVQLPAKEIQSIHHLLYGQLVIRPGGCTGEDQSSDGLQNRANTCVASASQ